MNVVPQPAPDQPAPEQDKSKQAAANSDQLTLKKNSLQAKEYNTTTLVKIEAKLRQLATDSDKPAIDQTISCEQFSDRIRKSCDGLSLVNQMTTVLNRIAEVGSKRTQEVATQLLILTGKAFSDKSREKSPVSFQQSAKKPGKDIFLAQLKKYQDQQKKRGKAGKPFVIPSWYYAINQLVEFRVVNENLPDAVTYLRHSETQSQLATKLVGLLGKAEAQAAEAKKIKNPSPKESLHAREPETGPESAAYQKASDKVAEIKEDLRTILKKATDIDITQVTELTNAVSFSVLLRTTHIEELLKFHSELAQALMTCLEHEPSQDQENRLPKLTVQYPQISVAGSKNSQLTLVTNSATIEIPSTEPERIKLISVLLKASLDIRAIIWGSYNQANSEKRTDGPYNRLISDLKRPLSTIISEGNDKELIPEIMSIEDPTIEQLHTRLLDTRLIIEDNKLDTYPLAVQQPRNFVLYQALATQLLFGDEEVRNYLVESLRSSGKIQLVTKDKDSPRSIVDLCLTIGAQLRTKNYDQACSVIDEEVTKVLKGKGIGYFDSAGILVTIGAIAANTSLNSKLRERIKGQDSISRLSDVVIKAGSRRASKIAESVEALKVEINRNLSDTLEHYHGNKKVVARIQKHIERSLFLLKHRERLNGIPTNLAFINGFLFYGPPGVGKSFLVKCIANHYGLDLRRISREEVQKAKKRTEVQKKTKPSRFNRLYDKEISDYSDRELAVKEYLETVVEELREQMKKNGAIAAILFIDEMEAEYLKRDKDHVDRTELEHTNINLRILEVIMRENPDIFVMGATNYMHLVDNAAVRFGRYGIKLKVTAVTEEDAPEFIKAALEYIDLDPEPILKTKNIQKLIDNCVDLTPEPIMAAIVRSYLVSDFYNKDFDPEALVSYFDQNLTELKEDLEYTES